MKPIEILLTIAAGAGPVFEKARQMIGEDEFAILIAKDALSETSLSLSPTKVARAINMSNKGAKDKVDNLAIKQVHRTIVQDKIDRLSVRKAQSLT